MPDHASGASTWAAHTSNAAALGTGLPWPCRPAPFHPQSSSVNSNPATSLRLCKLWTTSSLTTERLFCTICLHVGRLFLSILLHDAAADLSAILHRRGVQDPRFKPVGKRPERDRPSASSSLAPLGRLSGEGASSDHRPHWSDDGPVPSLRPPLARGPPHDPRGFQRSRPHHGLTRSLPQPIFRASSPPP